MMEPEVKYQLVSVFWPTKRCHTCTSL